MKSRKNSAKQLDRRIPSTLRDQLQIQLRHTSKIEFLYYFLPFVTVVLVVAFRISVWGLESGPAFLPFFIAVIVSTWYGSLISGITTTFLAALVGNFLFIPPSYSFNFDVAALTQTGIFIIEGLLLTLIIESRKRAFGKLETEHRRVTHILESITDAFIATDNQWNISFHNRHIEEYLGNYPNHLSGKNLWDQFPKLKNSSFYKRCQKSLKTLKQTHFEIHSPESNQLFEVRTYPSTDGLNIYITDITERKEKEQLKDNFISIASHELRTPATTIQGFAQLMHNHLKKSQDSKAKMYSEQIIEQLNRLIVLLNLLLDVSRIQSGKLELEKEPFNLNNLVKDCVKAIKLTTKSHQILIEGKIDQLVLADKYRIEQVLSNLISNAIKYSPNANKILINLSSDSQKATISITDYGIGIPKQQYKRIFDRFYRVSERATNKIPGIGLGLFIASQIIKQHKGKIWVDSEIGKGSAFHFTIPLAS